MALLHKLTCKYEVEASLILYHAALLLDTCCVVLQAVLLHYVRHKYHPASRLGGVVVSVLVTGPKGHGFDKNPQHIFVRMGSKAGDPMS
jgi:hypothetical protein